MCIRRRVYWACGHEDNDVTPPGPILFCHRAKKDKKYGMMIACKALDKLPYIHSEDAFGAVRHDQSCEDCKIMIPQISQNPAIIANSRTPMGAASLAIALRMCLQPSRRPTTSAKQRRLRRRNASVSNCQEDPASELKKQSSPEQSSPEQSSPEQSFSEQSSSEQSSSEQSSPEKPSPEKPSPNQASQPVRRNFQFIIDADEENDADDEKSIYEVAKKVKKARSPSVVRPSYSRRLSL
ncbi:hypothetical protein F4819DRAFT_57579 [Hypoxylon fuscum]|nr:hypothetical protein F4819DRAFT_57579 [Hypoxylon fuscum]